MAYSKSKLEIHTYLAGLYEKHGKKGFIHFKNAPDIKGIQYLEPLIAAIETRQVVRITYLPYYEDRPYFNDVHPYVLKEYGFRWYLVGWNAFKEQMRTYALDRIRDLQDIPSAAYRNPDGRVEDYFKYAIGIIAPEGAPPLIRMSVQKTQAQYLISQPWHDSQNIVEETDETIVFSFRVHPTYEFKSLVLGLGKDAEILEPAALRDELNEEWKALLALYGDGRST
ncbi:MAG: WYL domain-containing protein [Bacteroidales bacterium]